MPGASYPFVFECSHCGADTLIRRTEAREVLPSQTAQSILDTVLRRRGWRRDPVDLTLYCPNCTARVGQG